MKRFQNTETKKQQEMLDSGMTFEDVSKHRNTKNKEMPESGMTFEEVSKHRNTQKTRNA